MMYNGKSRHIRRKHNTVRELLSSGIITVDYVMPKDNVSDPLTKDLSREGVERASTRMGLRPRTSQHGGKVVILYRVKGPSPAETQKEEPPALTQLLSINDHTKTRAIVVMDIVVGRRERYEKSKEVSAACKSLEKARKKVKKLKARRDTAKQEAAEMESKVSTAEEELSKCSDIFLATTTASKVVEKKKKVLEATLQDFMNYKLYYD
ncbi:hypothetical protein BC332_25129 [Capsicum chinense]|nr:hypothetical protein BC332_25129 [Capsicum chinense]